MVSRKYIHLLFVVGLSFHFLPVMTGEFVYGSIPTEEVAETTKAFSEMVSEIISDNHMIMPITAGAVVAGLLFCGRKKISIFATNQCNALEPFITKQREEMAALIEKECTDGLKKFEESSLRNRCLLSMLTSSLAGLNYIKYNQWYMGAAAVVASLAKVAGHPYWGMSLGTAVLIKGWNKQDFAEMHARFGKTDENIEAAKIENARLHAEANKKLVKIESDIKDLSTGLAVTGASIATQVRGVEIKLSDDIKVVGENLTALDGKLKDIPAEIVKIASELQAAQKNLKGIQGSNAEIIQQNHAISQQTNALSLQLTNATQEFVSTKKQFDALGETLTAEVKQLGENTRKQLDTIEDCAGKQIEEIEGLKAEAKKNFEDLFERVKESSLLLRSFKNIQESHDSKLIELMGQLNESKEFNESTLKVINELVKSQKGSASQYNKMATELVGMNTANTEAFGLINSNVTKLNQTNSELKEKMEQMEQTVKTNELNRKKDQKEIINEINTKHNFVEKKIADSDEVNKNNYEDLKKNLEEQKALLNILFKQNVDRQEENKVLKKEIRGLRKGLEEQKAIAVDTNQYVKATHGMAMNITGQHQSLEEPTYPLSVPVDSWNQEPQPGSRTFPTGKKLLLDPRGHTRQPSSGGLGLLGIGFQNPK